MSMQKSITQKNNEELYGILCEVCDFDNDHIPKHGMGEVIAYAEHEGKFYECNTEWDYSWGIDWNDYQEWNEVKKIIKSCPCCGRAYE